MSDSALQPEEETKGRRLTSEVFLGTMVAVLSILTAIAAYQGAIAGAAADDAELKGLQLLTASNTEFLSANQLVIYDYILYDTFYIDLEEHNDEDLAYIAENQSEAFVNNEDRGDDIWSDAYYDEQFADATDLYEDAFASFAETEAKGAEEDGLQMIVLIFALGISFAAWASLADENSKTRLIFAILAIIATILGLVLWIF